MLTNIFQTAPFDLPASTNLSFCGCSFDWCQICAESFHRYGVQVPAQRANWSRKRQAEYIAGRYCAIQALTDTAEPNSRPELQIPIDDNRRPQWPLGTLGSISHSRDRAIAIAARDTDFSGLGIDCETLLSDTAAAEIAPWVVQRNDLSCKIEVSLSYGLWVTLIFSAKESLFKALAPTHKKYIDFGQLSNMFFVSQITAKTLILNTEPHLDRGSRSNSQFELFYRVVHQQIYTMALLPHR